MVIAYHAIITVYGFWLPNDPRGSWSDVVRKWELLSCGGPATKVTTRRSLARVRYDAAEHNLLKYRLKYPTFEFSGVQARAVARGFARACADAQYCVLACAIMPDHAHIVFACHKHKAESIVAHFKRAASQSLREEGVHPFQSFVSDGVSPPSPWARGRWIVYINSDRNLERAIEYVNDNPVRAGLRRQNWKFVRGV